MYRRSQISKEKKKFVSMSHKARNARGKRVEDKEKRSMGTELTSIKKSCYNNDDR